ncbi:MAG TPA: hypothetical protein VEA15_08655 [Caulobacteraceae bacterium]|nr:hypothetical protein [Caulobacteraceae bacterium]
MPDRRPRAWLAALTAGLTLLMPPGAAATAPDTPRDAVLIVGALHRLHETQPAFDYAALKRVIEAADPDILLLEVRPDELAERKDTPGRPEYPRVVWPLLDTLGATAVPMEPGGAEFERRVKEASDLHAAFARDQPEAAALLDRYDGALGRVLARHWKALADTHDAATDDLMRGRYIVQFSVGGDGLAASQREWDDYMVREARRVVKANPGKRILVLGSYRNRHLFHEALAAEAPARVVDMRAWLSRLP